MELTHLKYFYEVAKIGSFTKASKRLRVTQPTISKTIQQIEYLQGVKLLDRTRRNGVTLTEVGKIYFSACEHIFQELENLKTSVDAQTSDCIGDLAIGASDNLCNYIFPALFEDYCAKYRKVRVKLLNGTSEEIKIELSNGKSEIGIFHSSVREENLHSEKLGFIEFIIAFSPKLKELSQKPWNPKIFEDICFIGPRISDYSKPYPILKMLETVSVRPKHFFETNTQETQKRMALHGLGYAVMPRYMILNELKAGSLLTLRAPKVIGSEVFLVHRKNKTLSKPAMTFVRELKRGLDFKNFKTPTYIRGQEE